MKVKTSPRLKEFDYIGPYSYFITILTFKRNTYFHNNRIANSIINYLKDISEKNNFLINVYCLMPDHIHFIATGTSVNANLKKFIQRFKQITSFYFKKSFHKRLWHLSYYDHIIRKEEDIRDIMKYILENPVRKGLIKD